MKVLTLTGRLDLLRRIQPALCSANFVSDEVRTTEECVELAAHSVYSGVVIDVNSIGFEQALQLTRRLRQMYPSIALVLIEGYLHLEQRLDLFEAGADECAKDSIYASELTVRLSLLIRLRRGAAQTIDHLSVADLHLDLIRRTARRMGRHIELRPKEFLLLEYLVRNAGRPVTRTMIIEHVWNSTFEGLTNVVDVYISALRAKIDRGFSCKLIQTTRGVGYTLVKPEGTMMQGFPQQANFAVAG